MILTLALVVPLVGAALFTRGRRLSERASRLAGALVAAAPLVLLGASALAFDPNGPLFQQVVDVAWIPSLGAGFRLGVDALGLALAGTSALLYVAAIAYPTDHAGRAHEYVAWMLFLEGVSVGLFLALDLLLFYVFFDLSLVGMYFLIAVWGHAGRERAALELILYTLLGSLVMLVGILALGLSMDPVTFDLRALVEAQPLASDALRGSLVLLALMFGLAVKTPLVPVHTWLPAAHVEAPAPASALLAGVLLKMGTFGMIRIAHAPLRDAFARHASVLAVLAVVSIVYGALVGLGQRHLKRRVAYTSITHMGYVVLGIAVAASLAESHPAAARLALAGAALEMVAHGLITGSLFFLAGSIWSRGQDFDLGAYGGLRRHTPRLALALAAASFASLGLPGFMGFLAEFQIFAGAVARSPWLVGFALLGVILTAALFLQLLQALLLGPGSARAQRMTDLGAVETGALAVLLGLALVLGVYPRPALDPIASSASALVEARDADR